MKQWIVDTAHAWLKVPKQEYEESKFQASKYSYQDDEYVYLEEDCDASGFLALLVGTGPMAFPSKHVNGLSSIRNKDSIGGE